MTALVLDRGREVLAAIYTAMCLEPSELSLAHEYGITLARYIDTYRDSLIVGLEVDGVIAGGMFFRDGEVHLGILPHLRRHWMTWAKFMMEIGFRGCPRLTAPVNARNARARKFIEAVGGVKIAETPLVIEYEVIHERMRYGFARKA